MSTDPKTHDDVWFDVAPVLSTNLRRARQSNGWSQRQMGERAGLRTNAIWLYESQTRLPDLVNLMRLCAALKLTPNGLLLPGKSR